MFVGEREKKVTMISAVTDQQLIVSTNVQHQIKSLLNVYKNKQIIMLYKFYYLYNYHTMNIMADVLATCHDLAMFIIIKSTFFKY